MIARRSQTQFANQWERTGTLNGLVEETHTGHALVLAFGRRRPVIDEFGRQNKQLYDASFRAQFLSGVIQPSVQFLGNLNYVVIAVLGGWRVASGAISLGDVQAFIQYSRQFTMPLTQIAAQMNMLQSGLASAERVFELPRRPGRGSRPSAVARRRCVPRRGPAAAVRLQHVVFRYDPETPLIDDLSLTAEPGQTVAIVGPTGAGKTTLVNLVMRFYDLDRGASCSTVSTSRACPPTCARRSAWCCRTRGCSAAPSGQHRLRPPETRPRTRWLAAARAAFVDHFVRTLPDGYETVIDEDAWHVSAGQRQLLTIARAFLADPAILILDEATSNVDTRTEVLIQEAMARLRRGRTSFVIAHRLSTIRDADTILVMNHGRIVEQGSHDELLRRHGFYYDLYNSQFTETMAEAS